MSLPPGTRLGRYEIVSLIGSGGMGAVYKARDERLDRAVALKLIGSALAGEKSRKRFWREARLAASVNHPNVCAVYEVGDEGGELFIAMELLEGESLSSRLSRGTLAVHEAVRIALEILAALEALHGRGLVHRDVKPANVFLTPHGVKLVDFGLARGVNNPDLEDSGPTQSQLTRPGEVVGTPHYMSPEQLQGKAVDARSDLFAMGGILFEMLTGRHAFSGSSVMEVFHATLYDQPPALSGSPAAEAVDRIVRRALGKRPDERHDSAAAMASALREALSIEDHGTKPQVRAMTRLIVLPFRILRPDSDTDFLAFSLPDAVASSLAGLASLVVRSSLAAARFTGEAPDLKRIAEEADVDLVLAGTLLRAGDQIRVQSQLMEAPGGSILWSHAAQVAWRDVFQLEEDLVRRIVDSISLPLTAREHRTLKHDVPASASAYEFYLRANQVGQGVDAVSGSRMQLPIARDLYLRSLAEDPGYAPAWARLGRCYRLLAKTGEEPERNFDLAEAAFKRALELNAELPMTHNFYALLETDRGRSADAMRRLLERAGSSPNDPELFAGLVQACRYCGLLEASIAAHERARRLDPRIATSVAQTHWLRGDFVRALETGGSNAMHRATVLAASGREVEALQCMPELVADMQPLTVLFWTSFRAAVEGRSEAGGAAASKRIALVQDPEAQLHSIRHLARSGAHDRALEELSRVIDRGFVCPDFLALDPWMDSLRPRPEFEEVLRRMRLRRQENEAVFRAAGGERVLGQQRGAAVRPRGRMA